MLTRLRCSPITNINTYICPYMFDISPVQTVQRGGGGDRRGGANVREVQRAGGREGGEGH